MFSIRPDYANALLDGTKRVEFRRTPLSADVSRVVIYATSPVQRIVGSFEVAGVDQMPPGKAWKTYREVGGIEKHAFDRYYEGAESAVVIQVRDPVRLHTPIRLSDLSESLRPPQSFMYLREDVQARMVALSQTPAGRFRMPGVPDLVRRVATRVLVGVTD